MRGEVGVERTDEKRRENKRNEEDKDKGIKRKKNEEDLINKWRKQNLYENHKWD